jgi:uncharacterized protein (TIGR03083 family)
MDTDPHHWIHALRHSHDRLASLVRTLDVDQLRSPSYHEWTIAEVISHLGSAAELSLQWLEAGVKGAEPPGRETVPAVWDAWNARTPEQQATDGLAWDERLVQRFESLSDDELARFHLSLFGMELDAANFVRTRLTEHTIHAWDVEVTFDPNALVAADAVTLVIDTLGFVAGRVGKPQGKKLRLRVRTSDPERDLFLGVDDAVELTEWTDQPTDGDLRLPAEAFLRLVYGRLDPDHAPEVEITAPDVTLDDLRRVFPGV